MDVVVLEVGLGGRLDATNCVRRPVVCGVASLGFDHMDVLGHTLPVRGFIEGVWVLCGSMKKAAGDSATASTLDA